MKKEPVNRKKMTTNKAIGIWLIYQIAVTALWFFIERFKDSQLSALELSLVYLVLLMLGLGTLMITIRNQVLIYTDYVVRRLDKYLHRQAPCDKNDWINQTLELEREERAVFIKNDHLLGKVEKRLSQLDDYMDNHYNELVKERNQLQSLISDISHQVKTPMTNVKMIHATLLEQDLSREKEKEFLKAMEGQLDKINFLLDSMIKTSRLETGMIQLHKQETRVYDLLASALGSVMMSAEEKQIQIEVSCDEGYLAYCDPKWTGEALFNLLDNAVKYTPRLGSILIVVESMEIYTRIDIKDMGMGIDEVSLSHIFERFYRGANTEEVKGLGIGLYLTDQIIRQENGYIKVNSSKTGGTCFSVFLPRQ